jgi:proliferating cell nuclear antigen
MSASGPSTDILTFSFTSPDGAKTSNFDLKLVDIMDSGTVDVPHIEYTHSAAMGSAEFQKICRDFALIGDTVFIQIAKGAVRFSIQGDIANGKMNVTPQASEGSLPLEYSFALRYMNAMTKAASFSQTVVIRMAEDVPLQIEYRNLKFYIAPKVEED